MWLKWRSGYTSTTLQTQLQTNNNKQTKQTTTKMELCQVLRKVSITTLSCKSRWKSANQQINLTNQYLNFIIFSGNVTMLYLTGYTIQQHIMQVNPVYVATILLQTGDITLVDELTIQYTVFSFYLPVSYTRRRWWQRLWPMLVNDSYSEVDWKIYNMKKIADNMCP